MTFEYSTTLPVIPPRVVRRITMAGTVVHTSSDDVIVISKAVGSTTLVKLMSMPVIGQRVTIKDDKGDCASHPITIMPAFTKIDGQPNIVLNNNFSSIDLMYNGVQWNIT